MWGKPLEYWAAIVAMLFFVFRQELGAETLPQRIVKTISSAFLAYALSPSLAGYLGGSEIFAVVVVMAVGQIALDLVVAVVSDREFIKQIIRDKMGGSK